MKSFLTTNALFLFLSLGWAQNTNLNYNSAVKVYNHYSWNQYSVCFPDTSNSVNHYTSISTLWRFIHPTFAFQWATKKMNFHELELTNCKFEKSLETEVTGYDSMTSAQITDSRLVYSTGLSLRYEFILNFFKRKTTKLIPSLGVGVNPFYQCRSVKPQVSTSFPMKEIFSGVHIFITPRIVLNAGKRLYFDLNIPLNLLTYDNIYGKRDNPSLESSSRIYKASHLHSIENVMSMRLGLGVKL